MIKSGGFHGKCKFQHVKFKKKKKKDYVNQINDFFAIGSPRLDT